MLDAPSGAVPVHGSRISGVAFYGFRVEISIEDDEGQHLRLAIGGPFHFLAPGCARALMDPEGEWTKLARLLSLKFAGLDELTIDRASNVRLRTTSGCMVEIPGEGHYENWELTADGRKWICQAGGGEPSYWGPNTPATKMTLRDLAIGAPGGPPQLERERSLEHPAPRVGEGEPGEGPLEGDALS
jgi:hypothetical protein